MTTLRLDTSWISRPATCTLRLAYGHEAQSALLALWTWAVDHRPDGDLAGLDDDALAGICGWPRERPVDDLIAALKLGFVEGGPGERRLVDWGPLGGIAGPLAPSRIGRPRGEPQAPPRYPAAAPPGFDVFWSLWPKKLNRGDAEKAWRQRECAKIAEEILAAVRAQLDWPEWAGNDDRYQYLPYPGRWLRNEGWKNERTPTKRAEAAAQRATETADENARIEARLQEARREGLCHICLANGERTGHLGNLHCLKHQIALPAGQRLTPPEPDGPEPAPAGAS